MNIFDEFELDLFEETGDIELAQRTGMMARGALDELTDTIAMLLGLGPCFTAEMAARLDT